MRGLVSQRATISGDPLGPARRRVELRYSVPLSLGAPPHRLHRVRTRAAGTSRALLALSLYYANPLEGFGSNLCA
jgi:hypothetical protein